MENSTDDLHPKPLTGISWAKPGELPVMGPWWQLKTREGPPGKRLWQPAVTARGNPPTRGHPDYAIWLILKSFRRRTQSQATCFSQAGLAQPYPDSKFEMN
jgi:hypothetical protein